MALGKNLKKSKLIPEDKEKTQGKSKPKKIAVKKKKELIEKGPVKKKKAESKVAKPKKSQGVASKVVKAPDKVNKELEAAEVQSLKAIDLPVEEAKPLAAPAIEDEKYNSGLPLFIAQKLYDKKKQLRKRYQEEIAALKGRSTQFVFFEIGQETYAVSIEVVKEVVPISVLSKTPNTPPHILGIAKVRKSTFVVFDLSVKFRTSTGEKSTFLMVVREKGIVASITLKSLPTTVRVNGDQISSKMQLIEDASLDVSYIKGLIQHDDKLVYYLDIIELLRNDKAIVVPDSVQLAD